MDRKSYKQGKIDALNQVYQFTECEVTQEGISDLLKELRTYYECVCPVCEWEGSSKDSICFRSEDDEDGPYCPECWDNGKGEKIELVDIE